MDLARVRKEIDAIDVRIAALLRRRMELSLRAGRLKECVLDPERELEVLEHVRSLAKGVVRSKFLEGLYRRIMRESRQVQERAASR